MMGLPHVTGVAWLLLQHKEALGEKGVGSITVLDSDKSKGSWRMGRSICLLRSWVVRVVLFS